MRILKKEEMSHTIFITLLAFGVLIITVFAYTLWWPNNDDTLPPEIDMERAEKVGKKTKARAAVARLQDKCSGLCPYNLKPVCGYDTLSGTSRDYFNECVFTADQCGNPNLKILNQGRCPKEETPTKANCKKVCPDLSAPMCGYDSLSGTSKEYANGCELSNAQCENPNLQLLYRGPCPTTTSEKASAAVVPPNKKCSGTCPKNYAPVCGYDSSSGTSKTYSNECKFSNEQCRNPNLKKLSQGPCTDSKAAQRQM